MRGNLAGVLMCTISLLGCSNDVQRPKKEDILNLSTATGEVAVQVLNRSTERKEFTGRVIGNGIDATLRVSSTGDGVTTRGAIAELIDTSGRLLFSLESTVNNATGELTYREATADDFLTLSMTADGERVRESYDANGAVASFEYPSLSDETQRHAIKYFQSGAPLSNLPLDVAEYVTQADAFHTYYLPHSNSSIHNNPAGELLAQILASPAVPRFVTGVEPSAEVSAEFQQMCQWYSACAFFACRFFPTANPICWYCTAASTACTIMMFACMWIGC